MGTEQPGGAAKAETPATPEAPLETRTPGIGNWSHLHPESASSGLTEAKAEAAPAEPVQNDNATPAPASDATPPAPAEPEKPASVQLSELTKRAAIAQRIEKRNEERERALSAREREMEQREKTFAEADPLSVLQSVAKAKGLDLNTLLRRGIQQLANDGKLAPEEQAKADAEAREQRIAALEKADADRKAAEKAREDQGRAAEEQRLIAEWQAENVKTARSQAEELPFVADMSDAEIAAEAQTITNNYIGMLRRDGVEPDANYLASDEYRQELLQLIEKNEKARVEARADKELARLRRLGKIPAANDNAASSVPASGKAENQGSGPANPARTLTNNGAAQRPNGARPLNDRDRYRWAAEAIPDTPT